jgi:very-short-patch-repair endonuclease/DNA-binding MarR family transcriptional regulator
MREITKEILEELYNKEKKSIRKIAKELEEGKTTIEYYLKKFKIQRRTREEANKLVSEEHAWTKGLTKENDSRIANLAKRIKESYKIKREKRINEIELKFGKSIRELINYLYWGEGLNQKEIAKKIGYDKRIVIELMNNLNIAKRPKYKYISSLKGEKHPMFGKSWNSFFGKEKADERRRETSKRFRELTIKRIQNNEFPFFDTYIEKIMAKELVKIGIPFVKQFNVDNKFVCDFAIPILKIIIECDGDYWHANPRIYSKENFTFTQKKKVQIDILKDKYLKEKGWLVLRFFELDIKNNLEECIFKIKETINKRMQELKKIKSPIDEVMK